MDGQYNYGSSGTFGESVGFRRPAQNACCAPARGLILRTSKRVRICMHECSHKSKHALYISCCVNIGAREFGLAWLFVRHSADCAAITRTVREWGGWCRSCCGACATTQQISAHSPKVVRACNYTV